VSWASVPGVTGTITDAERTVEVVEGARLGRVKLVAAAGVARRRADPEIRGASVEDKLEVLTRSTNGHGARVRRIEVVVPGNVRTCWEYDDDGDEPTALDLLEGHGAVRLALRVSMNKVAELVGIVGAIAVGDGRLRREEVERVATLAVTLLALALAGARREVEESKALDSALDSVRRGLCCRRLRTSDGERVGLGDGAGKDASREEEGGREGGEGDHLEMQQINSHTGCGFGRVYKNRVSTRSLVRARESMNGSWGARTKGKSREASCGQWVNLVVAVVEVDSPVGRGRWPSCAYVPKV
jgi:hypothetical protein